ncbi:Facilitated trehalose transporter Tret1 [Chamberlinius hualienensis]
MSVSTKDGNGLTLITLSMTAFDQPFAHIISNKFDRKHPENIKLNILRPATASLIVVLASLIIGAGIGYPSTAVPNINSIKGPFKLDKYQQSWIASLYFLGAVPGALLSGWTTDYFGRKCSLLFGCLPFLIGWVIIASSVNWEMMLAGRILSGFCFGLMLTIVGVYISEISPPKIRGILMSFHELALNIGILLMYVLGTYIRWDWLAIVCAAILALMAFLMLYLPETPRWLIMNNRREEAEISLQWLRGEYVDISEEIRDIIESIKETKEATPWLDYLKPPLLKCFIISEFLYILQELSGINVVRLYTVSIFQAAHTSLDPNLQAISVGVVLVFGSTLFTSVVEKRERRVFLLISSMMMALSLAALGAFFAVNNYYTSFAATYLFWLPVLAAAIICVGYVLGVGPMPYVITSELFPNRARGRASGMGVATLCLFGFFITKYFVNLSAAIGDSGAFFVCSGICLLGFIIIYFMVPETKGKKLEVIQSQLTSH